MRRRISFLFASLIAPCLARAVDLQAVRLVVAIVLIDRPDLVQEPLDAPVHEMRPRPLNII
eukprot:SAG11_NODE_14027_length_628_cov_0.931947_2_plen_60_part_01